MPVNSMKLPGDPWNNLWSGFYGIAWDFSMEFRGKCQKSLMENIDGEISMETGFLMVHGISWQPFPWKMS